MSAPCLLRLVATFLAVATLVACLPGTASATPDRNPPVVFVHGISESACDSDGWRAVLAEIERRLPQTGLGREGNRGCDQERLGMNPLRFRYVPDQENGRDRDKADGRRFTSDSGAGANARGLRSYIDSLEGNDGKGKVMLVAYSLGGLITRSYLSDYPEHANRHVAAVAFVEAVHQGSPLAVGARGARFACPITLGVGPRKLCIKILETTLGAFGAPRTDSIAVRDLSPRSERVKTNADSELPSRPRYLNVYGDIRVRYPLDVFDIHDRGELRIGDGVTPPGDPDPAKTPVSGGAQFDPDGVAADQIPLRTDCPIQRSVMTAIVNASDRVPGLGKRVERRARCILDSPFLHTNIPANADRASVPEGGNVAGLVAEFLVDSCKRFALGRCAPEPLARARDSCGTLALTPPDGKSLQLEVQIEDGELRCSDARRAVTKYRTSSGPCNGGRGAGTCFRIQGPFRCVAPTAGSFPVVVRCDGHSAALRAIDTAAFPVTGAKKTCPDARDAEPGDPFSVLSNISCQDAETVARAAAANTGHSVNFTCKTETLGIEHGRTRCSWGRRYVQFDFGA